MNKIYSEWMRELRKSAERKGRVADYDRAPQEKWNFHTAEVVGIDKMALTLF